MKHRRDIQIEGMDLTVFVTQTNKPWRGPEVHCRVHAPLFPDVVTISAAWPHVCTTDQHIDDLCEQIGKFAWQKELGPFYRQCVKDQKAGLPMDRINVFYRRHPELREAA
jgi:hypothetical protein